jgi:hypothetical protein
MRQDVRGDLRLESRQLLGVQAQRLPRPLARSQVPHGIHNAGSHVLPALVGKGLQLRFEVNGQPEEHRTIPGFALVFAPLVNTICGF